MARPKSSYMGELAERARADLESLDRDGVAAKLQAIVAAAKHPLGTVAEIMGVARQTVVRWVGAYRREGAAGLRPKPKRPRPSKLSEAQKAAVLSWLDSGKTSGGEAVHWTLGRLVGAVAEEFGVSLSHNAIWAWLRKEGMRPKVPRPRHHLADAAAQADFKKRECSLIDR